MSCVCPIKTVLVRLKDCQVLGCTEMCNIWTLRCIEKGKQYPRICINMFQNITLAIILRGKLSR